MILKFSGFLYRNVVKPILFLFPADNVHEFFLHVGSWLGKSRFAKFLIRKMWRYDNSILTQTFYGCEFKNPIGLSAGFDYNADLVEILPSVGFGFHTIGTLTHESYAGNKKPMLGRLPKSRSLLVNKGLKNNGVKEVLSNVGLVNNEGLRGVSIGATNKVYSSFENMVDDIVAGFRDAENFKNFSYYELNISCPNLINIKNLKEKPGSPRGLLEILQKLSKLKLSRPVFIKMPLERTFDEIAELIEIATPFVFIRGLIFSNLLKNRNNPSFDREEIQKAGQGNFSGKPVENKSNEILRFAYKKYHDRFLLIGVGGVFTAEDAYRKILFGASLVQLITGMIYMGPQQIGLINKELVKLLKRDGFRSIKEAIGTLA